MIMHICVGTRDLGKAGRFYDALAAVLGNQRSATTDRAIYYTSSGVGIAFAVTLPFDGNPATFGNGTMATIGATDRDQVAALHAAALANGGSDEGAPGLRDNGHFVAYWRDPDGNKMNAVALG